MNSRRVYTPLGFTVCPLDCCSGHTINRRRVYTPLVFVVCPYTSMGPTP